jgi:hypothetical protein
MAVRERTRLLDHNIANDGINAWAMNVNCRSELTDKFAFAGAVRLLKPVLKVIYKR